MLVKWLAPKCILRHEQGRGLWRNQELGWVWDGECQLWARKGGPGNVLNVVVGGCCFNLCVCVYASCVCVLWGGGKDSEPLRTVDTVCSKRPHPSSLRPLCPSDRHPCLGSFCSLVEEVVWREDAGQGKAVGFPLKLEGILLAGLRAAVGMVDTAFRE